jgi:hypothetical protein
VQAHHVVDLLPAMIEDAMRAGDLPVSFTATLDGKLPGNHSASHQLVQEMGTSLLSPT